MKTLRAIVVLVLALTAMLWGGEAAELGPTGHPRITYNIATSAEFDLPPDIAKVMALATAAPDYFEFDNHAAHAQTQDLKVDAEGRILAEEKLRYKTYQKIAHKNSERWHDLYFNAAVREARKGNRERAAFLLGYTLHNVQDFATHQGMTYVMHAGLSKLDENPDQDPVNLARANKMAALDIAEFRRRIGDDNWRLFRGEVVRRSDGQIIKPKGLPVFGRDLKRWNPFKETLPRTILTKEDEARLDWTAEKTTNWMELFEPHIFFKPDRRGRIKDLSLAKYKAVHALIKRQKAMVAYLDLGQIPTIEAKNIRRLAGYGISARNFKIKMAKAYLKLPAEDRKFLFGELNWHELNKKKLERLKANRKRYRRRLTKEVTDPVYKSRDKAWQRFLEFERQWKTPPTRDAYAPPKKKKPVKIPEDSGKSLWKTLMDLFTPAPGESRTKKPDDTPTGMVERAPEETPPPEEEPKGCEGFKWVYTYEEEKYLTIQKVPKTVGFKPDGTAIVKMRDDVVTRTRINKESHLVPCSE